MANERACSRCDYWQPIRDPIGGFCQRKSPSLVVGQLRINDDEHSDTWEGVFPITRADVWCGDFQAKAGWTNDG